MWGNSKVNWERNRKTAVILTREFNQDFQPYLSAHITAVLLHDFHNKLEFYILLEIQLLNIFIGDFFFKKKRQKSLCIFLPIFPNVHTFKCALFLMIPISVCMFPLTYIFIVWHFCFLHNVLILRHFYYPDSPCNSRNYGSGIKILY